VKDYTKPAGTLTLAVVYIAQRVESGDYDEPSEIHPIAIGPDRDTVYNALINALPSSIVTWSKRYEEWNEETYLNVLDICPDIPDLPWVHVTKGNSMYAMNDDEGQDQYYTLDYNWDVYNSADENNHKLTNEQKDKLFKLLGGHWDCSRSTSMSYSMHRCVLVPTEVIE
jgi:hypothetical protein